MSFSNSQVSPFMYLFFISESTTTCSFSGIIKPLTVYLKNSILTTAKKEEDKDVKNEIKEKKNYKIFDF
jgi:hypothetical protein